VSEMMRSSGADGSEPSTSRGRGRTVRMWCVDLAVTAGLVCAIGNWGLGRVLISVFVVAMVTAVIASSTWEGHGRPAALSIARVTFAIALIMPAAVGLIAVLGFAGVLIVLALAATTPALTSRFRARRRAQADAPVVHPERATPRDPATSPADGPADAPERELSSLADVELCLIWRQSFLLLETARTAAERQSVVELRQLYLDELHRRSPEGFAAWLASGARASGNPFPYVDDARRRAS
jgi:hypothetical protein